jgi:hypothetical protein
VDSSDEAYLSCHALRIYQSGGVKFKDFFDEDPREAHDLSDYCIPTSILDTDLPLAKSCEPQPDSFLDLLRKVQGSGRHAWCLLVPLVLRLLDYPEFEVVMNPGLRPKTPEGVPIDNPEEISRLMTITVGERDMTANGHLLFLHKAPREPFLVAFHESSMAVRRPAAPFMDLLTRYYCQDDCKSELVVAALAIYKNSVDSQQEATIVPGMIWCRTSVRFYKVSIPTSDQAEIFATLETRGLLLDAPKALYVLIGTA